MSKKITKKISKKIRPVLNYMKGKVPVKCPNCAIRLLRDPLKLSEKCNNCLQDVTYEKI